MYGVHAEEDPSKPEYMAKLEQELKAMLKPLTLRERVKLQLATWLCCFTKPCSKNIEKSGLQELRARQTLQNSAVDHIRNNNLNLFESMRAIRFIQSFYTDKDEESKEVVPTMDDLIY